MSRKRLTIKLRPGAYRLLKTVCSSLEIPIQEFVIDAIDSQLEDLHDLAMAEVISGRVESGEEEVISWEEMKQRLGWGRL